MGRVVLSAPNPAIGAEFVQEARELLALGYQRAAAIMARLSIEAAVLHRLEPMGPRPGHKSFGDAAQLFRRGTTAKGFSWTDVDRTYQRLSKFAHVDGETSCDPLPTLVDQAETFRQLVATAEATYQAAAALEARR